MLMFIPQVRVLVLRWDEKCPLQELEHGVPVFVDAFAWFPVFPCDGVVRELPQVGIPLLLHNWQVCSFVYVCRLSSTHRLVNVPLFAIVPLKFDNMFWIMVGASILGTRALILSAHVWLRKGNICCLCDGYRWLI